MALKARDQVKTVFGTAPLQLKADPGESLLVKGLRVYSNAGLWMTLKTEKTTVGFFAIEEARHNHLAWPRCRNDDNSHAWPYPRNLLDLLFEKGIFTGYPIAEGESFMASADQPGSMDVVAAIYDVYDAEDQKNTNPNGSKSAEYMLINYGDTGAAIDAPGDHLYDNPLNPVEFPAFPLGVDVPAKHQITLHAILAWEAATFNATPALAIHTKYLKLIKDREVLFDEDRNGIPFSLHYGSSIQGSYNGFGYSLLGHFSSNDPRLPLFFAEPLVFDAGDELNVYTTVLEPIDGSTIPTYNQLIGFIETVKRIVA